MMSSFNMENQSRAPLVGVFLLTDALEIGNKILNEHTFCI